MEIGLKSTNLTSFSFFEIRAMKVLLISLRIFLNFLEVSKDTTKSVPIMCQHFLKKQVGKPFGLGALSEGSWLRSIETSSIEMISFSCLFWPFVIILGMIERRFLCSLKSDPSSLFSNLLKNRMISFRIDYGYSMSWFPWPSNLRILFIFLLFLVILWKICVLNSSLKPTISWLLFPEVLFFSENIFILR